MPFLGELIEVKKSEIKWEGALERLLHGSALNVLVEEKYYSEVTAYVKENHLRGKFSFIKIDPKSALKVRPERDDNLRAFSKVDIKNGIFTAWLERHLRITADHICCESATDLMALDRGITKEGLIKNDSERHVKDDRNNVADRTKYILGWDTKLKRDALIAKIQSVALEFSELQKVSASLKKILADLVTKLSTTKNIGRIHSFNELSFKLTLSQIAAKEASLKILIEQNKNVKLLRSQLEKANEELSAVVKLVEEEAIKINRVQFQIDDLSKKISQYRETYESVSSESIGEMFSQLDLVCDQIKLDLNKLDFADAFGLVTEKLRELRKSKDGFKGKAGSALTSCMSKFKNLWQEESYDLESSIQFADEFLTKYKSLTSDDLPKYESRFREMFTRKGLHAVLLLEQAMREKVDEIRDSIELINKPLKNTFYSPTTKISLLCKDIENSRSVGDFQARLRKCLARTTEVFDSERQMEAFQAVDELVNYLTSKETETERTKALDVRNWLDFYAIEANAETGAAENYYWSSGGGSGGQKTKLTLTILASAMAYQFGLTEDAVSSDSFNFVMLDEAFARMDQKNSELVLSIFKEVGFQIMVASPPMYGFLVEPHIECFHFASINDAKSKSRIYTATREQAEKHLGRKLQIHKSSQSGKATRLENHGRRQ